MSNEGPPPPPTPLPLMIPRILAARRDDCSMLSDDAIVDILKHFQQYDDGSSGDPRAKLQVYLQSVLQDSVDNSSTASQRRSSWLCSQWLLQAIDDAKRLAQERASSATRAGATMFAGGERRDQRDKPSADNQQRDETNFDDRYRNRQSALPLKNGTSNNMPVNGHDDATDKSEALRKRRWGEPLHDAHAPAEKTNASRAVSQAASNERLVSNKRQRQDNESAGDRLEHVYASFAHQPANSKEATNSQQHLPERAMNPAMVPLHTALKSSRKQQPPANKTAAIPAKPQTLPVREADASALSNGHDESRSQATPKFLDSPERPENTSVGHQEQRNIAARWAPPSKTAAAVTDESPESSYDGEEYWNESHDIAYDEFIRASGNDDSRRKETDRGHQSHSAETYHERVNDRPKADSRERSHRQDDTFDSRHDGPVNRAPARDDSTQRNTHMQIRSPIRPVSMSMNFHPFSVEPGNLAMHMSADNMAPGTTRCFSGSLRPRPAMKVSFRQENLSEVVMPNVFRRLEQWDPYWVIESQAQIGQTFAGVVSVPVSGHVNLSQEIKTAVLVKTRPEHDLLRHGVRDGEPQWGTQAASPLVAGTRRVLLRMLPIKDAVNRADCHMWPQGTFLQINGKPVHLDQRRQTNQGKWEGPCKTLDVTPFMKNGSGMIRIEMCCYDDEPYYFCLAICRYRSPLELFHDLMNPRKGIRMVRLIREHGLKQAKRRLKTIAESTGDDEEVFAEAKFTFSLVCPISKQLMREPVRGRQCKHWQCYDLQVFLESNRSETPQRWRCAVCDNFLCVKDFLHCILTCNMLKEFKDIVSTTRDRVEFRLDGTYDLLPESRPMIKRKGRTDASSVELNPHASVTVARSGERQSAIAVIDKDIIIL